MPVEVFTNDGLGIVTSGGTTAVTGTQTWTVSTTNAFPAASNTATPQTSFYVCDQLTLNETEKILVTNISGSTWTVTRGADGTTPVAHLPNFTIVQVAARGTFWGLGGIAPSGDTTGAADSANITAALSGGAQRIRLQAGTFWISAAIALSTGQHLAGAGNNATTVTAASGFSGPMVKLSSTAQVSTTVRDLLLNGNSVAGVTYGIALGNTGIGGSHLIQNVLVTAVGSDGINCGSVSSDSKIRDCHVYNCFGGNGITLATDMEVSGCTVGQVFGHGIFAGGVNNQVVNNKVYEAGWNGSSYAGTTSVGILVSGAYTTVVGNSCQQNALHGIQVDGTIGTGAFSCTITGNECDTNSIATVNTGSGIYVNQAGFCVITGNTGGNNGGIPGSQLWGIQVNGSSPNTVMSPNAVYGSSGALSAGAGTGYAAPSLATGFTNTGGSNGPAGYKSCGDTVRLRGSVNLTATEAAFTTIFTLPTGMRPTYAAGFVTPTTLSGYAAGNNTIVVTSGGAVQTGASGVNGNQVSLEGIVIALD